jgi:imidazolonepropionase-like amidohydrolase
MVFKRSILAFTMLSISVFSEGQQSLIIENVTVIDGTGAKPRPSSSVQIIDNKIHRVIRGNFPSIDKKGAELVNGTDKFLIPGLIDVHIHLAGGIKVTANGLRKSNASRKKGIRALHGFLYSGVTSVYDAGNDPNYIFSLRKDEREGKIVSPRIFATGGIVSYPGSHGTGYGATTIESWPQAKAALDKHINRAPDILKLTYEERGWGSRPMIPMLPLDLMQEVIEYYNDQGIRTTVHTSSELRAREAIFAGVDSLAHPVIQGPISSKFAKLMGAKKIPMATTLTIGENYSRLVETPEYLDQFLYKAVIPNEEIRDLKTVKALEYKANTWTWWMKIMTGVAKENIKKISDAGGILAVGTDQTVGPAVHREMELLSEAGISNIGIIQIATLNGAKWLGKDDELGSIEEGKLADLVLLDADPSENINNAKMINMVIKDGKMIVRGILDLPINN